MQGVGSVVDGQFVFFAVEGEFSFGDTVAVASDGGVEERLRAVEVWFTVIWPCCLWVNSKIT